MKHISLLIALTCTLLGWSQSQQTIRGRVVDGESKNVLPGATISIYQDSMLIAADGSNPDGAFRLENIPVGRYTLIASYIGYAAFIQNNLLINSGKETILEVNLTEDLAALKAVSITANSSQRALNQMATVSSKAFNLEETQRYAGSRGDPARMVSNYAGIRGADDSRNDIIIRGNSPLGVLWRLDGLNIPNPNHFALFGTTGGPVSILNNRTLGQSDFFTGAFPAEYGNALAGAFDLKMRPGNNEQHEFALQFGFLGAEIAAEGPMNKNSGASYMATYRYSTLSLMQAAGIQFGVSAIPKYQDYAVKLYFPLKKGHISFYSIGGQSDIALLDATRDSTDWSFGDTGKDVIFGSSMTASGINWFVPAGKDGYIKAAVGVSTQKATSTHLLQRDTIDFKTKLDTPVHFFSNQFLQSNVSAHIFWNKKFNAKNALRIGMVNTQQFFSLFDSNFSRSTGELEELTAFDGRLGLTEVYAQWKYRATESLTILPGMHSQHYGLNNNFVAEPRLGIEWIQPNGAVFAAGYGLHHQTQPNYVYFQTPPGFDYQPFRSLGFTRSQHLIGSYAKKLGSFFHFKAEIYHQWLSNIPIQKDGASSFSLLNEGIDFNLIQPTFELENAGTGTNKGIEVTLEKFFSHHYFFLFSGSLYDSKYIGSDGIERNTNFNGNYAFNLLGGAEYGIGKKKTTRLGFGGKITYAGGNRYTPIDKERTNYFETYYISELAWENQFPNYFRTDLKFNITFNRPKISHELALDAVNIFNTKNILTRGYDPIRGIEVDEQQLGFLPIFYYRVEF